MNYALDLDLLRTFQTVARFGQFRAASEHLNRSPSAVSTHIRLLEERVGSRLLDRDNQGVFLTPAGRRFLLQTAELLRVHDRILAGLGLPKASGRVRLGISEEYARPILEDILPDFLTEHPGVEFEVVTAASLLLAERLREGGLDLAVLVRRAGDPPPVPFTIFGTTQPVWARSTGYRLTPEAPVPLALHGPGCPYRLLAIETLEAAGRDWRLVVTSDGASAVEVAIATGLAFGVLDRGRLPPGVAIAASDEGLPPLPAFDLQLATSPGQSSAATELLGELIRTRFHVG